MDKFDDIDDWECEDDYRWSILYENCIKLERAAILVYEEDDYHEEDNKWVEFWGSQIRLF